MENTIFCLCRCTKRKYAEDLFYNGNLYFNYPIEWIKMGEDGNLGQGDSEEGVYTNVITKHTKQTRGDSRVVSIKGAKCLRSDSLIKKWPCVCFYCASEQTDHEIQNGTFVYNMAKDYVGSFCDGESFLSMLEKPLQERTSMVVILETGKFLRKIRSLFDTFGLVEEKDYFMHTVIYRNSQNPFLYKKAPYELFYKNESFKKQQEFRIVLNPYCKKIQELLLEGHKLHIGSIEDIAMLKTNFYDGATIGRNDHLITIEAPNWTNRRGPLNEWELQALLQFMRLAYHTTSYVLDNKEVNAYSFWAELTRVLYSKYSIEIRHCEFIDGKNDQILMIFHLDDIETILKNEEKDGYFYARHDKYKSVILNEFRGGYPSGVVDITYGKKG